MRSGSIAAMVAVGLWGAFLGRPAIWILPVVIPLVIALAATAGVIAVPWPFVEAGIAASAIVLGLLITFAVFHGHARGTKVPQAANPFA
jgi:urease accessory protein